MTPIEAIYSRHSVRQYQDRGIPEDILKIFSEKVADINREYSEQYAGTGTDE